ncbi:MAG: hypothetical protein ACE361_22705 [Aureliella sp.]
MKATDYDRVGMRSGRFLNLLLMLVWLCIGGNLAAQSTGVVEIDLLEKGTETPLISRVRILDEKGRGLRARGAKAFEFGWNLIESPIVFRGRPGPYRYEVFNGPEYSRGIGDFVLDKRSEGLDVLRIPRHADLKQEGYVAGDLAAYLPGPRLLPWLAAERLAVAVQLQTTPLDAAAGWRATRPGQSQADAAQSGVWVEQASYLDGRPSSGLALHHWSPPSEVPAKVSSTRLLVMAKNAAEDSVFGSQDGLRVHAEVARPWAQDLPIWLASGKVDSIRILGEHLTIDGKGQQKLEPIVSLGEGRFFGALKDGRSVEALYWKILEAGFRIPPSAGSGFGKRPSPLGYNRVYAMPASEGVAAWWQALTNGHSFVTNGPLLRATVNGQIPGHVFNLSESGELDLEVALTLTVSDPVDYLDVIFNGQQLYQARLDEYAKQGGKIPTLTVKESGWLIVRVVTGREDTYRLAFTAPFYFEVGGQERISRSSVEFFQQWLGQAKDRIASSAQAADAGVYIQAAEKFWQKRLESATVD